MDYGAKVSQKGFNVLTCSDKELVFSSKFNTFRTAFNGSSSQLLDGSSPKVWEFTHGLGYVPAFMVLSEIHTDFGGASGDFYTVPFLSAIGGDVGIIPYTDANKLYIYFGANHSPGAYTINFRYFVYYNKAK